MSDELIEAMARAIHDASHSSDAKFLLEYDWVMDMRIAQAKAALAVIRAHLEPTSEMVEAVMDCGPIGCCNISSTEARDVIIAALAASPIGEIG